MNGDANDGGLSECLRSVLSSDDPRLARLGMAGTSVSFQVPDAPEQSVTVLLDRNPPTVTSGEEPAEITIELSEDQASRLARGVLRLPPAMLAGQIAYRGPVRKYLMVDAVLRSLLAELNGTEH
jgi:hypothetical protein